MIFCARIADKKPACRVLRKKDKMMKSDSICKAILAVIFCILVFLPLGCSFEQPGETTAEGSRRHKRVLRINQSELMSDTDKALLLDQPSKLTDKRIP
jgi:YbbR domain-containing protein